MDKVAEVAEAFDAFMTDERVEDISEGLEKVETLFRRGAVFVHRNREVVNTAAQVVVLFYGPLFQNTVVVGRAFRDSGWPLIKTSITGLADEYWKVREAKRRRKGRVDAWVLVEAVDPKRIETLVKGLLTGLSACIATLHSPTIQILACGMTLGEYVTRTCSTFMNPIIMDRIQDAEEADKLPVGSRVWAESFLRVLWTLLGVYVASVVRRPLVVAAAVTEASHSLTETLVTRFPSIPAAVPPIFVQHALTALGLYHIFVLGGYNNLPSPLRVVLWLPLQVEGLLAIVPGAVRMLSGPSE